MKVYLNWMGLHQHCQLHVKYSHLSASLVAAEEIIIVKRMDWVCIVQFRIEFS